MALDVFISPELEGKVLASAAADRPHWRVRRSGLRRRVTQLVYENPETDVALTLMTTVRSRARRASSPASSGISTWCVRTITARRPLSRSVTSSTGPVASSCWQNATTARHLRPNESVDFRFGRATQADVLDEWRELNAGAWTVAERHGASQIARTSRAAADAFWHWQMGLTARREAFSHLCWLPALTWLHKSTTHEALRVAVWAGGQAEGLPEADLTMYMPPPYKGGLPPVLLPQSKVLAALEDLIATTQATDGTTVKYVPESMSDECMRRGAALTTGLLPMNRNLYEPVDLLSDE